MPVLRSITDVVRIFRKIGISMRAADEKYEWEMEVLKEENGNVLVKVGYMDRSAEFLLSGDKPVEGRINNWKVPEDELEYTFNLLMFPLDFFLRSQDERVAEGNVDESIGRIEPIGEREMLGMRVRGFRIRISDLARKYLTEMIEAEYWLAKIDGYDVMVSMRGIFSRDNVVEVFLNNLEIR